MKRRKGDFLTSVFKGFLLFLAMAAQLPGELARAEVVRVLVERREDVLGGKEWEAAGT